MTEKRWTRTAIDKTIRSMEPGPAYEWLKTLQEDQRLEFDLHERIEKAKRRYDFDIKEKQRLKQMQIHEIKAYEDGFHVVAGIDEVGRGPLAGPVSAACVILHKGWSQPFINDSKLLSQSQRERLHAVISEQARSLAVAHVEPAVIDAGNIKKATCMAMQQALDGCSLEPDYLLIDAMSLPECKIEQCALIKGDQKSLSIAAASIVAKVERDRLMQQYGQMYPQYGFEKHKGYGTKEHIQAIMTYGTCPIHRLSFLSNIL